MGLVHSKLFSFCLLGTGVAWTNLAWSAEGAHADTGQPERDEPEGDHDEHRGHHHDGGFSLGVSLGPSYLPNEKEFGFSAHGHLLYELGSVPLGFGVGYEALFDEHRHQTMSLVFQYRIIDAWLMSVSPGVTFELGSFNEPRPTVHLETVYEFRVGLMDLGPAFEFAIEPEGTHLTLALHAGVHF